MLNYHKKAENSQLGDAEQQKFDNNANFLAVPQIEAKKGKNSKANIENEQFSKRKNNSSKSIE